MTILNHFNFKRFGNKVLITNDAGRFCFLLKDDFLQLISNTVSKGSELFSRLAEGLFISDQHPELFSNFAIESVRKNKNYLFRSTSLFIFVVTTKCNANCIYCQAKDRNSPQHTDMSIDTALKAVDLALSAPSNYITIEFQGGEPLLNFPVIKAIIEYCKSSSSKKHIQYSLVSNLTVLTDEMLEYLILHKVSISTSIDGNQLLHNKNRPLASGDDSFNLALSKLKHIAQHNYHVGAIETTTRLSLPFSNEIVDTYVSIGMKSIFLRPLTPLGFANNAWNQIGYTADEYTAFYKKALNYIINLNRTGTYIKELHATIWLRKILSGESENYMELRSPCGASLGQIAFYCDGRIFTCDEARMLSEMGNDSFCLGDVNSSTYNMLIDSPVAKACCSASILESVPSCCDCVYQPYCGTCPVVNLATNGDIFSKSASSFRCEVYKGMLNCIFEILLRNDPEEIEIFKSWL